MSSFQPNLPPILDGAVNPVILIETGGLVLSPSNIIDVGNTFDINVEWRQDGLLWSAIGAGDWQVQAFFDGFNAPNAQSAPITTPFLSVDTHTYNVVIPMTAGAGLGELPIGVYNMTVLITYRVGGVTPGPFTGVSDTSVVRVQA